MLGRKWLFWIGVSICACSSDGGTSDSNDGTPAERHAIGKADSTGTCADHCGEKSSGNCWCDAECSKFGDCCADIAEACPKPPSTCAAVLCGPETVCIQDCDATGCAAKCVANVSCATIFCAPEKTCKPYPGCTGLKCPGHCVDPTPPV